MVGVDRWTRRLPLSSRWRSKRWVVILNGRMAGSCRLFSAPPLSRRSRLQITQKTFTITGIFFCFRLLGFSFIQRQTRLGSDWPLLRNRERRERRNYPIIAGEPSPERRETISPPHPPPPILSFQDKKLKTSTIWALVCDWKNNFGLSPPQSHPLERQRISEYLSDKGIVYFISFWGIFLMGH